MKKLLVGTVAALGMLALTGSVEFAGNLAAAPATRLDLAITGANAAVSATEFTLETGKYYRLTITSDGGAEVLFTADELFLNSWLNQIVVAGAEIKLWGLGFRGIEVGEAGTNEVQITFVPVRPGDYAFYTSDEDDAQPAGIFHVM